ncbi:MAG TPA: amino acid adenylation domain-containing protein [Pyrinomonadaceae bacterium]|nr:amino acid adenylation domain-containing protein [Pyrinomonadaceae bacterium]
MEAERIESVYKLAPLQQGMLFHSLLAPDAALYVQQLVCLLHHPVNATALERAWQSVMDRYSVLRTGFRWEGLEEPVQEVRAGVRLLLDTEDWTSLSSAQQREKLDAFLEEDRRKGFDFTNAPLLRLKLFRFQEDDYCLVWTSHHALMDGRSRLRLLKEVFALYGAGVENREISLPEPVPYQRYVQWLRAQDLEQAEPYWRELLKDFRTPNAFAVSKKESQNEPESYGETSFTLSSSLTAALLELARREEITLNTIVQGCWSILLSRYSDQEDVVCGTARACRWTTSEAMDAAVGLFINTVPFRIKVTPDISVTELLKQLRQQALATRAYEQTPLAKIQDWSDIPRGLPLFETIVVFENYQLGPALRSQGGEWNKREFKLLERTNYPLALSAYADYNEPSLILKLTYEQSRFDDALAQNLARQLQTLFENAAANPSQPISELRSLSEAEQHRILFAWNETGAALPENQTIHQLFELQARQTPAALALICGTEQVTFAELNMRANQLAHYLKSQGVAAETRVAISMQPSSAMIIALLGILKAGAAYVPIEYPCPPQRFSFILKDSGARLLLTQQHLAASLPPSEVGVICVDGNSDDIATQSSLDLPFTNDALNAAHVIYTSGSTGTPKGVVSAHRASVNRFAWMWRTYPFAADEVCCQKTSLSFVDSIWEIFGPLLQGVVLLVIDSDTIKDPARFIATLVANRVTRLVLVPSLLRALLETSTGQADLGQTLRYCVCSGEALPVDLAAEFQRRLPHAKLINLYGSTEVAADVTCYEVKDAQRLDRVPIGRPISNAQIYILDPDLRPVAVGLTGELYVGGEVLARNYLDRPEMTAERFVPNPFSTVPGARLFRTGDLGRYLPDGNIEYLGRRDHQVKVRGFRIELGEIEAAISTHPKVSHCVVITSEDNSGDKDLFAFVIPHGERPATEELRTYILQTLPQYMLPSGFAFLESLPLTSSGKPDRRALAALVPAKMARDQADPAYMAPRTSIERSIAGIWEEVLGVRRVSVHDDFLSLGGTSLKAMRVLSRVERVFHLELPLRSLFDARTTAQMATVVENALIEKLEQLTEEEAQSLLDDPTV